MSITDLFAQFKGIIHPPAVETVIDGRHYTVANDRNGPQLGALITPPAEPTLQLATLTGFVDAFAAGMDDMRTNRLAVHVIDYRTVAAVALDADGYGHRHEWLRAFNQEVNPFPFDEYQKPEMFLINLQSGFLPTENVISLQRLASSLSNDSSIGTQDDGLAQTITVKQGTVTRDAVQLPPRIDLFAYRTFREIDPTGSQFMVRLKAVPGQVPHVALLQIDAGKWKHDTMLLVRNYLATNLPADTIIIA